MSKNHPMFKPAEIADPFQLAAMAEFRSVNLDSPVTMLPEAGKIGGERRFLYFYQALDQNGRLNEKPELIDAGRMPAIRILAFGDCNVACPYCKRGCQFIDNEGNVIEATETSFENLARVAEGAVARGETVRFSGGDPVTHPRQTLALAEYLFRVHGHKMSIAHNGSGPAWIGRMKPYLSSAAIDLKAVPEKIAQVMDVRPELGPTLYGNSLKSQAMLSHAGVLVDVRTPIFGDTSLDEMRRLAHDITEVNDLDYTFWTWRLYKPVEGCDWSVPDQERVIEMMKIVSAEHPRLWMGLRAKWEKSGMLYFREGAVVNG